MKTDDIASETIPKMARKATTYVYETDYFSPKVSLKDRCNHTLFRINTLQRELYSFILLMNHEYNKFDKELKSRRCDNSDELINLTHTLKLQLRRMMCDLDERANKKMCEYLYKHHNFNLEKEVISKIRKEMPGIIEKIVKEETKNILSKKIKKDTKLKNDVQYFIDHNMNVETT